MQTTSGKQTVELDEDHLDVNPENWRSKHRRLRFANRSMQVLSRLSRSRPR